MPYANGKRVTLEEYLAINGSTLEQMRTGPRGVNPGEPPVIDEEVGGPVSELKAAPGRKRSGRSEKAAKAAVANALGVTTDSKELADIDVSGLDTEAQENE